MIGIFQVRNNEYGGKSKGVTQSQSGKKFKQLHFLHIGLTSESQICTSDDSPESLGQEQEPQTIRSLYLYHGTPALPSLRGGCADAHFAHQDYKGPYFIHPWGHTCSGNRALYTARISCLLTCKQLYHVLADRIQNFFLTLWLTYYNYMYYMNLILTYKGY